jgi:hypothetical protein
VSSPKNCGTQWHPDFPGFWPWCRTPAPSRSRKTLDKADAIVERAIDKAAVADIKAAAREVDVDDAE